MAGDEFSRSQAILGELDHHGRVVVTDLAAKLGVSPVTVRKDLQALEERSVLRRVRGGAVAAQGGDEGSFEVRMRQHRSEKDAIARAVAPLVHDGDVVALDSSTTCHHLARRLLQRRGLVVVTNSLALASLFSERSDARVLLPGGVVRRAARSVVGLVGDVLAGRGRIDHGFISGNGISAAHGVMDLALEEAEAKRYLAGPCRQVHALLDSSKFGAFSLHASVPLADLTAVWTDDAADADAVAEIEAAGVPVHTLATGPVPA